MLGLLAYGRVLTVAVLLLLQKSELSGASLTERSLVSLPKSWGRYIYGPANHCFIGFSLNCSHLLALLFPPSLCEILS